MRTMHSAAGRMGIVKREDLYKVQLPIFGRSIPIKFLQLSTIPQCISAPRFSANNKAATICQWAPTSGRKVSDLFFPNRHSSVPVVDLASLSSMPWVDSPKNSGRSIRAHLRWPDSRLLIFLCTCSFSINAFFLGMQMVVLISRALSRANRKNQTMPPNMQRGRSGRRRNSNLVSIEIRHHLAHIVGVPASPQPTLAGTYRYIDSPDRIEPSKRGRLG